MRKLLALAVLLVASVSTAQRASDQRPDPRSPAPKEIVFEDPDLIDGATQAPLGTMVDVVDRARHESLLKVRTSFREKVLGSAAELP